MENESPGCWAHPSFEGRIGMARRDVTPWTVDVARAWGCGELDGAAEIQRMLYATAFAFLPLNDDLPLVLVEIDLGWWCSPEEERSLRAPLLAATSVAEDRFMLHATHWFPGSLAPRPAEERKAREAIDAYLEDVHAAISEAVRQAVDTADRAALAWTTVRCDLAADLTRANPSGEPFVWGFGPTHPPEDTVLVGRVTTETQGHLATLVNYACRSRQGNSSAYATRPTYIHVMRETVERATAGVCLFLQGTGGDLAPRCDVIAEGDFVEQAGRQLGHSVLSALWGMFPHGKSLESPATHVDELSPNRWCTVEREPSTASAVSTRTIDLPLNGRPVSLPIYAWRLGDAVLVGIAAEACSALQIGLRRSLPNQAIVVMNDVNGHVGRIDEDAVEPLLQACLEAVEEVTR